MSGLVIWITGLPSSGKTTLARDLAVRLRPKVPVAVLDGDAVREAVHPAPGYDEAGRAAFYETLARLAALLAWQGLVVLVPATAHRRAFRALARELAPGFLEVFVDTPLEECQRRDDKGLYAQVGAASTLPGVGVAYEAPLAPEFVVRPGDPEPAATLAPRVLARALEER